MYPVTESSPDACSVLPQILMSVGRFESSVLNWLTNAGIRLSMAELVCLHERQITVTNDLLHTDNRQKLVEHAFCRVKVTAAAVVFLKNKKIVIL